MQYITLKTGEIFDVNWCGISQISQTLRIQITSSSLEEVNKIFSNSESTEKITYFLGENVVNEYEGYTEVYSIIQKPNGIVVSLKKVK